DTGLERSADELTGRNMWLLWTGGNDRFRDRMTHDTFGAFDLLKTISSHPKLKNRRGNRWNYLGLTNEPCFDEATGPDPEHHGLWLDRRRADCPADPFANEEKYPGVAIGARGKNLPVGSYYGEPTGVVGLRLFPNPAFDEAAAKRWDPERFYTDPAYYNDKDLVRPYRVGMSCAFCHVGPSPIAPPDDPENPKWENINATVGSQYFWIDRIFAWEANPANYMYQLVHTQRPGTLDTSLVSTDYINNPRTMNAIYNVGARLGLAKRWGEEKLAGGELDNKQLNDFVDQGPLTGYFAPPNTSYSPRVLKDGADSVGILGALNRVYLNIGLYSEEWTRHFNPIVGGKPISPIEIAVAQQQSVYWQATEQQSPLTALYFLEAGRPDHLADAPGGAAHLSQDAAQLERGKLIFADRCARCHSSKIPEPAAGLDPGGCAGPNYLQCWSKYWAWTKTDEFRAKMQDIVLAPDFLDGNYLSTDFRVPVTLLQTNACSPLATNAIAGNIWDNFSSQTYKSLPSVGSVTVHNPVTGEPSQYQMPAGGRGYTRVPSLISLWSTAPYLLNNTVGRFDPSPSVEARLGAFQNGIEQMLWPEKRAKDPVLGDKVPGLIDRTTVRSYLTIPVGFQPELLITLLKPFRDSLRTVNERGDIEIGPIPAGVPVQLISNIDFRPDKMGLLDRVGHDAKLARLLVRAIRDLRALPENATDQEARTTFANLVDPMLELSKCKDFVVNRGHYFGTDKFAEETALSDAQKTDLIEFLKTF
ncbi:MAG: cytochrome c, partial [Geminicoccaceae bacterium]